MQQRVVDAKESRVLKRRAYFVFVSVSSRFNAIPEKRRDGQVEELVRLDSILAASPRDSHGKGFPTVYPYGSRTVGFANPCGPQAEGGRGEKKPSRSMHRERTTALSPPRNGARSLARTLARSARADNARKGQLRRSRSLGPLLQTPLFHRALRVDCLSTAAVVHAATIRAGARSLPTIKPARRTIISARESLSHALRADFSPVLSLATPRELRRPCVRSSSSFAALNRSRCNLFLQFFNFPSIFIRLNKKKINIS